jgi:hypothetical protein
MTPIQLRTKLADMRTNLSALERLSGVHIRTLRRLRHGQSEARQNTVDRIAPHLKACRK